MRASTGTGARVVGVLLLAAAAVEGTNSARKRWGRIEPRATFRPPYSDLSTHWDLRGGEVTDDGVRFNPKATRQPGSLWTRQPSEMGAWEATFTFFLQGAAPLNTGEGLGFWYARTPSKTGSMYGHDDTFAGLGVFFDSYDADGDGDGDPYVMAMTNDGAQSVHDAGASQIGVCFSDYRNTETRVKISFIPEKEGLLTVGLDVGATGKFKSCISATNVHLNPSNYFGLTVADFAGEARVGSFLGVNTTVRFHPDEGDASDGAQAPGKVSPMDSDSEDIETPQSSEHAHFLHIMGQAKELSDLLLRLEDESGKQFATILENHNKHFATTLGASLTPDISARASDVGDRLVGLLNVVRPVQNRLGELRLKLDSLVDPTHRDLPTLAAALQEVRDSCIAEGAKGHNVVSNIRDSVATLKQRDEDVLTEVHARLEATKNRLADLCESTVSAVYLVGCFCVGVVGGVLLRLVGRGGGHSKRW